MGFVDNIKNIFFKGSVEVARTTPEKTSDIFKAYIPEFLYKPPFGYPRKANLPLLRQLSETPYVFAVIKTLCDEASSLEWDIQVKEEIENPEQYDEKLKEIRQWFDNPNGNDESWEHIQRALIRDILELDSGVLIKVFNKAGEFSQVFARDGMTFLKNTDIYGYLGDKAEFIMPIEDYYGQMFSPDGAVDYTGVVNDQNKIRNYFDNYAIKDAAYFQYGWTAGNFPVPFGKREIVYIMQNPRSDSIYGRSPVSILSDIIQTLHYGSRYHLDFYVNSNMPEGAVQVPGASPEDLKALSDRFNKKVFTKDDLDNNARKGHTIPFVNNKDGELKFVPFAIPPKEMEIISQQQWFSKVLWMSFGVTPDEMGITENSNRAVAGEQAKVFKRKAIRPICNVMKYHVDTQILPEFTIEKGGDWNKAIKECPFEFKYNDYDPEEDLTKHEIYKMEIEMGVRTPEMAAEELGINVDELVKQKDEAAKKQQELMQQYGNDGSGEDDGSNGDDESSEDDSKKGKQEEQYKEKEEKAALKKPKKKKITDDSEEDEEEEPEVKSDELAPEIIKYIKDVSKAIEEATKLES